MAEALERAPGGRPGGEEVAEDGMREVPLNGLGPHDAQLNGAGSHDDAAGSTAPLGAASPSAPLGVEGTPAPLGVDGTPAPLSAAEPYPPLHGGHLTLDEIAAMDLEPDEIADEEQLEEEAPSRVAIGKRFSDWRTLVSFAFALAILAFAAHGIKWATVFQVMRHANILLFLLAFVVYYASFPIRTHRWRRLMHNSNHGPVQQAIDRFPLWDLTQILYLSWFANVIVPAKLGDVYRAFLARRWLGVSMSRTVGTILAERILDLLVLFPLLVVSAFLTFQSAIFSAHDASIRWALLTGLVLAIGAGGVLIVVWRAGDSLLRFLPHRLHEIYQHFRHGAIKSFGREAPSLAAQTVVVWLLEGGRLMCILLCLQQLTPGKIGPAAALFLALGSSVLTTLPLTPGGLGFVETFIPAMLVLLGVPGGAPTGVAVVVLDRIISYLSIAVFGFIIYAFTDKAHSAPALPGKGAAASR